MIRNNPARESDFAFLRYSTLIVVAQIASIVGVLWLA